MGATGAAALRHRGAPFDGATTQVGRRCRTGHRPPPQNPQHPTSPCSRFEWREGTDLAEVVIGTAGHVDHGKTWLIRALTGQDTDRLPEEKRRGISIDLGFAEFVLPSGRRAGIIDVPGHERFIKNMVAGVTGIDLVLFVVAADEGVMPQTREHLQILELLGVESGVVVLTKVDLVDDEWLRLVEDDVRSELAGSFLAQAPLVAVSAKTGQGLDRLTAVVDEMLPRVRRRPDDAYVRLPIDRVFTVAGFGTVVTGTLVAGRIRPEDRLEMQPGGFQVRVRQVQVHGRRVEQAEAGQRTAVNLVGVDADRLSRGQVLVTPGTQPAVDTLAAACRLLDDTPRPLKSGTRVRFHIGTSEVLGRVVLLDRDLLEPGQRGFIQFKAETPVVAARGDRFIIRSYSPLRTIGGGVVLDPGRRHRRRRAESLDLLATLDQGDLGAIAAAELDREPGPVDLDSLARRLNVPPHRVQRLLPDLAGRVVVLDGPPAAASGQVSGGGLVVSAAVLERLSHRVVEAVSAFHRQWPVRPGVPRERLRADVLPETEPRVFAAVLDHLAGRGLIEVEGEVVRLPGHRPRLDGRLQEALDTFQARWRQAGAAPPSPAEVARELGLAPDQWRPLVDMLVSDGRWVRVAEDFYLDAGVYQRMVEAVRGLLAARGGATVAEIRDVLGTSRKYVVPFLEHLDQRRVTRRVGDLRQLAGRGAAPPADGAPSA